MFDDDFTAPQALAPQRIGRQVWGVSALVKAMADALAARFGSVTVRGEITGFSRAASGHCYFTLKDERDGMNASAISCAMFRRAATMIDFSPKNGDVVELRAKATVYEARGSLQLVVEHMQRVQNTQGNLWLRFEALKQKLANEGLFDAERKLALPRFVRCVAVVTSLQAAALKDVLSALERRAPHVLVRVYPSAVQGQGAAAELVQTLQKIEQENEQIRRHLGNKSLNLPSDGNLEADAVLLVRGGGSLEDLWAFNEEVVVRAVAACAIPIICGVGHETDFSLCDFASDLRAPTPTAAAELVSEPTAAWLGALDSAQTRLQAAALQQLDAQAQRLDWLTQRIGRPQQGVQAQQLRIERLQSRLHAAMRSNLQILRVQVADCAKSRQISLRSWLAGTHARLATLQARTQATNPQNVLARGYAVLTSAEGAVLSSVTALAPGSTVHAHLQDGRAELQVQGIEKQT